MSKTCGECRHFDNDCQGVSKSTPASYCEGFERKPTIFQQITASPEVLAEKLVYSFFDCDGYNWWTSTLCNHTQWESRAEAIVATVARLKDVENERNN